MSTKKGHQKPKLTSVAARRNRIPVALAAVVALVVLGTSFPLSALLSQRSQLSSTSAELNQLKHQNSLLTEQQRQLNSTTDVDRLARQEYQMVLPGQTLYDVLPPSGIAAAKTSGSTPGDPGSQPLVSPANAPDMTPDPNLSATPALSSPSASGGSSGNPATGSAPAHGQSGSGGSPGTPASSFWSRVAGTLEFWK